METRVEACHWWRTRRHTLLLLVGCCALVHAGPKALPGVPVGQAAGVAGSRARLPCLASHDGQPHKPSLVLWYKDRARFPFYTLDLRDEGEQQEFVSPGVRGRASSGVSGAYLTLDPLHLRDSVAPSHLTVLDTQQQRIVTGQLGPLTEGEALSLVCVAAGGWPAPEVTWWRGSTLLHNITTTVLGYDGPPPAVPAPTQLPSAAGAGTGALTRQVRAELSIPSITRDYVQSNLTCRASNTNLTQPLVVSLALLLHLRPKTVNIQLPESPLVAGQRVGLECVALGAHPAATLTWTKTSARGTSATPLRAPTNHAAGRSSSLLMLRPEPEDNGSTLTCAARNPRLDGAALTTTIRLDVVYAPRVRIRIGSNLAALPITEGSDIYFECEVTSNPPAKQVIWHRNGEPLNSDRQKGVLVSNRNLVLQTVPRSAAGNYTCSAANRYGTTTSNPLPMTVMYTPVCVARPRTVAVGEGETARLACHVEAEPDDQLSFTWVFNNTLDTVHVSHHRLSPLRGQSILDYTPRSTRDYGTLSCWAANALGTQADPCRFTVIEAGPPDNVGNCDLLNLTVASLEVACTAGRDGGRPQWFVAQVYEPTTHRLLATLEEATPRFRVDDLTPGQDYLITVMAVNDKGASRPVEISAVRLKMEVSSVYLCLMGRTGTSGTPRVHPRLTRCSLSQVAEKRMVEVPQPPVSPLVGVFLGLVGGFVVLLLAGVLLSRRCWGNRRESGVNSTSDPTKLSCSPTPDDPHHQHQPPTTSTTTTTATTTHPPQQEPPTPPYVISATTPFLPRTPGATSRLSHATTSFYTLTTTPQHTLPTSYHTHHTTPTTTTTPQFYTHSHTPATPTTVLFYAHTPTTTTPTTTTSTPTTHYYSHTPTYTAPNTTTLHHTLPPNLLYHTRAHSLTSTTTTPTHYHTHTTTSPAPYHTSPYHTHTTTSLQTDTHPHLAVDTF
ncbi:hemicentin-2-like isoform X2 [Eriocheir sinensis]|uniref:hemicentin-2-like isoform X2 n=1 Tax=Eriocheir sinensis TaxID=95602 RepID=UPI0021C8380D|nr:hemicentin-2-like isoform X2 [Eriocheir sinensis]